MEKSHLHLYLRETVLIIMLLVLEYFSFYICSKNDIEMTLSSTKYPLLRVFFHAVFYLWKRKKM